MARPRKSVALKEALGTIQPSHEKKFQEISVAPFDMSVPRDLKPAAAQFWVETVPELIRMGLLSAGDRIAVKGMAQAWGDYEELRAQVEVEGYTVMGHNGMQINPSYKAMGYAFDRYFKVSTNYAMTPKERASLNAKMLGNSPKTIDQAVIGNTDAASDDSPIGLSLVKNVSNL
jgi:P27 family predicted phage terminase small subunit